MALTLADAAADCRGEPRPDSPDPYGGLGIGAARGDVLIPGEVCAGPCRTPLDAGDPYAVVDGEITCLGCAARGTT